MLQLVVVAVTNVGIVLPFGLRNLNNFQNSFWLCGCILAKNAFLLCLNFATTLFLSFLNIIRSPLFPLRWTFLKYRFLFLINWMISLFSQGKFFLHGSMARGIHCSMISKKVVLKHDQLSCMLKGSITSSISMSHNNSLALSNTVKNWVFNYTLHGVFE